MKIVTLLSIVFILPSASLLAKGQSEIEILRARVDVQERKIIQLEKALNRLTGSPSQIVTQSTHATNKKAIPVPQESASNKAGTGLTREYTVAKGDTLTRIAHRHHTSVASIQKENNLKSDGLRIGQKLRIPARATVKNTKTAETTAKKEILKNSKAVSGALPSTTKALTGKYTVKAGDTFYGIARQYQMNEASLQAANPKAVPTRLQIGQVLVVKPGAKSLSAPKPSTVAKKTPTPKPASKTVKAPKPKAETSKSSVAKKSTSAAPKPSGFRTITVHQQMTYGAFASQHGASTSQLNSLNGLNLNKSTMLAKGSELYVPQF